MNGGVIQRILNHSVDKNINVFVVPKHILVDFEPVASAVDIDSGDSVVVRSARDQGQAIMQPIVVDPRPGRGLVEQV